MLSGWSRLLGNSAQTEPVIRFQDFQVNLETGEVRKNGIRLKLQDQPFKVLVTLLQRPGRVVTREELRQLICPKESFGDFDHAINLAVTKLRNTLGDSADVPHLIETLPRRGYRFIASVERPGAEVGETRSPTPRSRAAHISFSKRLALLFLFLGFLVLIVVVRWLNLRFPLPRVVDSLQITKDELPKNIFRLMSDGTRLYFQASLAEGAALVQVSNEGSETAPIPVALKEPLVYDISPARPELLVGGTAFNTPKAVAFSVTPEQPLWVVPLPAGPPHRVGDVIAHDACWAPDGSHLVFANDKDLFVARPDGNEIRKLATLGGYVDWMRFSPDGTRLRFNVFSGQLFSGQSPDIFEMGADGTGLHRLLSHACCGAWSGDGKYYFYHSGEILGHIWVLPERRSFFGAVELGTPFQLTAGPVSFRGATTPSAGGKQLFVIGGQVRVELVRYEGKSGRYVPFLGGISAEELEVSRDGQWAVYTTPCPDYTLFRSKLDGSERLQLTFAPMKAHEPRWSPDGKQILFADYGVPPKMFVVPADGGTPKQLMPEDHPNEIGAGTWLPDGNSIIFVRVMGCPTDNAPCWNEKSAIYKLDLKSQHVSKLPGSDGMENTSLSRDGRYLTAFSINQNKMMLHDFQTERWSELTQGESSISWSHDGKFVYMVRKQEAQPAELIRISIPEGKIQRVLDLSDIILGGFWPGYMSLLPDDSPLLTLDKTRPEIYRLELQYQ